MRWGIVMEKVRIGLLSRTGPALPTSARYVYAPNGSAGQFGCRFDMDQGSTSRCKDILGWD